MLSNHGAAAIDTRWFKDMLADRRLSQRRLAALMGLDPAAVSLMIRGKRKLSTAEASEIARLLNVGVEEVAARAGGVGLPDRRKAAVPAEAPAKASRGPVVPPSGETMELPVPMADGSVATLVLPRRLAKEDAERISALVRALSVP